MDKPEALRLADELDAYHTRSCHKEAAAELRRLHAVNQELLWALKRISGRCDAEPAYKIARAAIKAVEEGK